jgi:hypothetical protein
VAAIQQDVGLAATIKTGNNTVREMNSIPNKDKSPNQAVLLKDDSDSDDEVAVVKSQDIMRRPASVEEEKKEDADDVDEDEARRTASYLPAGIRPAESYESKSSADGTITSQMSALSTAPSVDETVTSQMGWF